jgi:hypothetical protein
LSLLLLLLDSQTIKKYVELSYQSQILSIKAMVVEVSAVEAMIGVSIVVSVTIEMPVVSVTIEMPVVSMVIEACVSMYVYEC